jgi:hypothetical protein
MPRTYATLETQSADLASEFGLNWATQLFGAEAIASLPIRKSGKNKGAPKGYVIWRKARTAGYSRAVASPLAVGQLADAWIGIGPLSQRGGVEGFWLGRMQPLSASASAGCFFEAGRAKWAREQAQRAADWEAEKADMAEVQL